MASTPSFQTERDLQAMLAAAFVQLGTRGMDTRLRREMPVGARIPDIVIVSFDVTPPTHLWPRSWSYRHASLVAELRRVRSIGRKRLAQRMFESESRIEQLITDLCRTGAVLEHQGTLRLSAAMREVRAHVVAIEAKLQRWSEAFAQAVSYRTFADRVMVAMDAGRFKPDAVALRAFRSAGVGLYVVDQGGIRLLHRGRVIQSGTAQREYVYSSALSPRSQTLWSRR